MYSIYFYILILFNIINKKFSLLIFSFHKTGKFTKLNNYLQLYLTNFNFLSNFIKKENQFVYLMM